MVERAGGELGTYLQSVLGRDLGNKYSRELCRAIELSWGKNKRWTIRKFKSISQ